MLAMAFCLLQAAASLQQGTNANFNETLSRTPLALVAFTAPWCGEAAVRELRTPRRSELTRAPPARPTAPPAAGHCKKLKPELEAASLELLADGVGLVEVDTTVERKLAHRFDVRAFPELLVHRRDLGTFSKYNGARTAESIVAHMRSRLGPACSPLAVPSEDWLGLREPPAESAAPMELRLLAQPAEPGGDSVALETLERAAETLRLHVRCATPQGEPLPPWARVGVSFARAFVRALAVGEEGALPPVARYAGPDDGGELLRWLLLHSRPAVGELNEQSARAYVGMRDTGVGVLLLPHALAGRTQLQKEHYAQRLADVAKAVSGLPGPPVFLTLCPMTGRIGHQLVADYGVDGTMPTLLLLDFTKRARKPAGYALKLVKRAHARQASPPPAPSARAPDRAARPPSSAPCRTARSTWALRWSTWPRSRRAGWRSARRCSSCSASGSSGSSSSSRTTRWRPRSARSACSPRSSSRSSCSTVGRRLASPARRRRKAAPIRRRRQPRHPPRLPPRRRRRNRQALLHARALVYI